MEPLGFSNFFSHFYIINTGDDRLSERDQKIAFAASFILGLCTLGMVHLGCWIAEKCITKADMNDEKVQRADTSGRDALNKGGAKATSDPIIHTANPIIGDPIPPRKPAEFLTKKPAVADPNVKAPKAPASALDFSTVPDKTVIQMDYLLGKEGIFNKAPVHPSDDHNDILNPETYDFCVMKGMWNGGPFIGLVVAQFNPPLDFPPERLVIITASPDGNLIETQIPGGPNFFSNKPGSNVLTERDAERGTTTISDHTHNLALQFQSLILRGKGTDTKGITWCIPSYTSVVNRFNIPPPGVLDL